MRAYHFCNSPRGKETRVPSGPSSPKRRGVGISARPLPEIGDSYDYLSCPHFIPSNCNLRLLLLGSEESGDFVDLPRASYRFCPNGASGLTRIDPA